MTSYDPRSAIRRRKLHGRLALDVSNEQIISVHRWEVEIQDILNKSVHADAETESSSRPAEKEAAAPASAAVALNPDGSEGPGVSQAEDGTTCIAEDKEASRGAATPKAAAAVGECRTTRAPPPASFTA
eukprot:553539-Pleurochrysis_carterae.AAC.2